MLGAAVKTACRSKAQAVLGTASGQAKAKPLRELVQVLSIPFGVLYFFIFLRKDLSQQPLRG